MSEVLVWATASRAAMCRALLTGGCAATGASARLEVFASSGGLFRRLAAPRDGGRAELVFASGPYMAESAVADGLLERWSAVDYGVFATLGDPAAETFAALAPVGVRKLAMPDPERSEIGMFAVLSTLNRARAEGDVEAAWAWWRRRAEGGLVLPDSPAGVLEAVRTGRVSHALVMDTAPGRRPVRGLAPVPHAVGITMSGRNAAPARAILDWLAGPEAANAIAQHGGLATAQAESNGLRALRDAAPALDIPWAAELYRAARARWSTSGFSPSL
jgi:hypothetical protein